MNERYSTHFENNEANRSQSVLLEVMTILGKYRKNLYLVGGWAPYFLLQLFQKPTNDFKHVGSIDIDIVVDGSQIPENEYATIVERIEERGYVARKGKTGQEIPFSFERTIDELAIAIDFLAGEYGGTPKNRRHQRIDGDLLARKARGADILPEHHIDFRLEGYLPDGAQHFSDIKMANIVSILAMKGITISERFKEKDAYDIYSLLAYYKEGPASCLAEITPHISNSLVKEGIKVICERFASDTTTGPTWAAQFILPADEADQQERKGILRRDIYESVAPFVDGMKRIL